MNKGFSNDDEELDQLAKKFESMMSNKHVGYFDVGEYEHLANHYLMILDISKAKTVIEQGLRQHPASGELHLLKAKCILMQGNVKEALMYLTNNESQFEKTDADYWLLLGELWLETDKEAKALDAFSHVMALSADDFDETALDIGIALVGHEQYSHAIRFLLKGMAFNPENPGILNELAVCYELMNMVEKAIEYYNKLLDVDPYNDGAWFSLGSLLQQHEAYNQALEAYDFALAISDSNEMVLMNKGIVLMKQKRYDEAIDIFKKHGQITGQAQHALMLIAECFEETGDFDKAAFYYSEAVNENPKYEEAWLGLGYCRFETGAYDESALYFKKALQLNKKSDEAWAGLGDAYGALGLDEEAVASYQTAITINPNLEDVWSLLAGIYIDKRNFVKAESVLSQAWNIHPTNMEIGFGMAMCKYKNGLKNETLNLLKLLPGLDASLADKWFEIFPDCNNDEEIYETVKRIAVNPGFN